MKKLVILSVFLFLFSISLAYADDVSLSYQIINNQIPPGGAAEFAFKIENNQTAAEDMTIDITDVAWNAKTVPLTDYTTSLHVPSFSSYTTKLFIIAVGKLGFKTHYVKVTMLSLTTGKHYEIVMPVEIRQDLIRYPLDLSADIAMPAQIDPRKSFSIKVRLQNNQLSILKNLSVSLKSNTITQSSIIELGPEEEKTVEFSIKLDEATKPQTDSLQVEISKDGNHIATLKKDFEIVSFLPPYKQTETVKRSLFVYTSTIDLTNEGNKQEAQAVKIPLKTFDSIFASTNPPSKTIQEDGDAFFAWSISLGPGETTSVQIIRNYMPASYAAILIITALILYYVFRSPLTVKKRASKISAQGEHITGVKVVLTVKNRSMKPVHSISLIDKVPNLVGFVRAGMETAKPNRASPHAAGTVIGWDIAVVEPGEERVFTYEIKPKLDVVGGMDLGPAIIQFKKGDRHFKKRSNSLDVYA